MSTLVRFVPGAVLSCNQKECIVLDVADFDSVLVKFVESGEIQTLRSSELTVPASAASTQVTDRATKLVNEVLPLISDKRWKQARVKVGALRELMNTRPYQRGSIKINAAADAIGRSPATIYRLLADYDRTQSLKVFLRLQRADKGKKKIPPKVDRVIRAVIKRDYLTDQRKMISTVAETIQVRCRKKKWVAPHKLLIAVEN